MSYNIPEVGFLRLAQILGQSSVSEKQAKANRKHGKGPRRSRPAIQPLIPVGKSVWWDGVKTGRYPQPLKISPRVTVWRAEDIRALIEDAGKGNEG